MLFRIGGWLLLLVYAYTLLVHALVDVSGMPIPGGSAIRLYGFVILTGTVCWIWTALRRTKRLNTKDKALEPLDE